MAVHHVLKVKDRNGKFDDVVLGFDNLDGYISKTNKSYFGAIIGRYANRIAHGAFVLDGHQYHIPVNDGPNSLHGGLRGFDKRVWDAKDASTTRVPGLELHYLSRDGEEGFPRRLVRDGPLLAKLPRTIFASIIPPLLTRTRCST